MKHTDLLNAEADVIAVCNEQYPFNELPSTNKHWKFKRYLLILKNMRRLHRMQSINRVLDKIKKEDHVS